MDLIEVDRYIVDTAADVAVQGAFTCRLATGDVLKAPRPFKKAPKCNAAFCTL